VLGKIKNWVAKNSANGVLKVLFAQIDLSPEAEAYLKGLLVAVFSGFGTSGLVKASGGVIDWKASLLLGIGFAWAYLRKTPMPSKWHEVETRTTVTEVVENEAPKTMVTTTTTEVRTKPKSPLTEN
jgi:hypothetical protein